MSTSIQTAILRKSPSNLSDCHVQRALNILKALSIATPYPKLGGVKVKRRPNLIRFKLGRDYRLIIKQTLDGFEPFKIMTRQSFQRELTRRS